MQDGRIAYLRGLGDAGSQRTMTPQTPLILGSLILRPLQRWLSCSRFRVACLILMCQCNSLSPGSARMMLLLKANHSVSPVYPQERYLALRWTLLAKIKWVAYDLIRCTLFYPCSV